MGIHRVYMRSKGHRIDPIAHWFNSNAIWRKNVHLCRACTLFQNRFIIIIYNYVIKKIIVIICYSINCFKTQINPYKIVYIVYTNVHYTPTE